MYSQKNVVTIKILLIALILCVFSPILFSHFQQDEWHNFGWHIYNLGQYDLLNAFAKSVFSFLPITQGFNFLNYYFFGIQNFVPAMAVLLLVACNAYLWELNVFAISKNKLISLGSMIFGYIAYISHQSVTWVLPSIATQLSFLFINLSIFALLKAMQSNSRKYYGLTVLFSFLAISSKVNSFFIFIFLGALFFVVYSKKLSSLQLKKVILVSVGITIAVALFIRMQPSSHRIGAGRFVESKTQLMLNAVILPTKGISQIMLSDPQTIYSISEKIYTQYYNRSMDHGFVYSLVTEYVSISISFLLIILFLLTHRFESRNREVAWFGLLFYFLSFAPYFVDKYSTATGFLESRYYYLGVFGLGVVICMYLDGVLSTLNRVDSGFLRGMGRYTIFFVCSLYLMGNAYLIFSHTISYNQATQKRLEILSFAKERIRVTEPDNLIFFIEDINHPNIQISNITGTYFQTGFLYPFLVYAYDTGYIPHQVFADNFYWNMEFQGLRQVDDKKIGLFYSLPLLQEKIDAGELAADDVLALQFDYADLQNNPEAAGNFLDLRYVTYEDVSIDFRKALNEK